ncbi:MAG: VCBS repeat-containing protein, partial [Pyrinomonadaceae bacterium]|nr:VCBS repeat-containing protein [Pyrinomonadaceae bacterium]
GKSDFVRNSVVNNNIVWSILRNPPGAPAQIRRVVFGLPTDTIIDGDFDGDLKQDIAVYREGTAANPQSYFYILPSTSPNTFISQAWGTTGDKPVTGDFDGDGKTDFCIVRRANNQIGWIILPSGGGAVRYITFGLASDRENPSAADFNGDGRDDLIVTRTDPNGNLTHYIGDASSGASVLSVQWGNNGFAPTTVFFNDYTGDNRADIAVNYGACNANPTCDTAGTWWILPTGSANHTVTKFGVPFNAQTNTGDRATFGDWDGDGKTDISVFRPSNTTLYALTSSNGQILAQFWDGISASAARESTLDDLTSR